jgi:hypothetical protein
MFLHLQSESINDSVFFFLNLPKTKYGNREEDEQTRKNCANNNLITEFKKDP